MSATFTQNTFAIGPNVENMEIQPDNHTKQFNCKHSEADCGHEKKKLGKSIKITKKYVKTHVILVRVYVSGASVQRIYDT